MLKVTENAERVAGAIVNVTHAKKVSEVQIVAPNPHETIWNVVSHQANALFVKLVSMDKHVKVGVTFHNVTAIVVLLV